LSEEIFLLPDVGEGLVEAEIVEWKVKVGDAVILNQPLVDIETAKAVVELPSPYAGTIVALHGNPGDVMEVHKPLITFEVGGATAPPGKADAKVTATIDEPQVSSDEGRQAVLAPQPAVAVASTPGLAPRSTPPVRLYAKQQGVDLALLHGTGRDGLITRDDVERALHTNGAPHAGAPVRVSTPITGPTTTSRFVGREIESWATGPKEERIAVKGVLRSMSDAMVQSAFSAPHAAVWVRVDATRTVELLESLKKHPNLAGVRLSPLTIAALAICDAARNYPGINSSFDAQAGEVVVRRSVNLGIAAATDRGLIVPNIKGADELDLVAMANALNTLVDTARQGTTTPNEMIGTTLTITNVGPMGVDAAMPILPPGTGAIVAIGQIAKAPWVVEDAVVVRHVMELAMSFDHRQIDGAMASMVLAHIGRYFSDPAPAIIAS
jgi:pyruvate dehydrogenase E2 component (dihydrolipoamide acetyltransferase)